MRQLIGFLVEYLILGSETALALLLWLKAGIGNLDFLDVQVAVVSAPLLYVFGMISDFIGSLFVSKAKRSIEKRVLEDCGHPTERFSTTRLYTYLAVKSHDLYRILQVRSARDRVARGTLPNILLIFAALLYSLLQKGSKSPGSVLAIGLSAIGLFALVYLLWRRSQMHSVRYEVYAAEILHEEGIDLFGKDSEA